MVQLFISLMIHSLQTTKRHCKNDLDEFNLITIEETLQHSGYQTLVSDNFRSTK